MASPSLNFDEATISEQSLLYELYTKLYNGMVVANSVDSPSYDEDPPLTEDGAIDIDTINAGLASYSDILMKNSAYLMANSIISILEGDGDDDSDSGSSSGSGNAGYVSRNGDSMVGLLTALHGFRAGYDGTVVLTVGADTSDNPIVSVTGAFTVNGDATINGQLSLDDTGIWFGSSQAIYIDDDGALNLSNDNIVLDGEVSVDGSISVGNVVINEDGITFGEYNYYHSGNSNKVDVDWTMRNAYVAGNINLTGNLYATGIVYGQGGFDFYYSDQRVIYTEREVITNNDGSPIYDDDGNLTYQAWVTFQADLRFIGTYGLMIDDDYILKVRDDANDIISLSAPNRVLNLGDSDNGNATQYISLQTAIKNYSSDYTIVSQYGDGNFPNSFSAGTGNAGATVMQTYYLGASDQGVVMFKNLRFNSTTGPRLFATTDTILQGELPYIIVDDENDTSTSYPLGFQLQYEATTSLFRDQSKSWSASLHISTDGEFFSFDNPVEASSVSIKSETYKTRLIENTLFIDDEVFLEGVSGGIRHAGNAYFDDDLSSRTFASGFAGYGWAIITEAATGSVKATFDELTIRIKFRAY